jgi:hypothetical protein
MRVSGEGGQWREGGRWVSRRKGGRQVGGGGRRFPKKIGVRGGQKQIIKKTVARREKRSRRKKNDADQVGDSFIPSMKIPERDFLDGALVGAGSLRPLKRENVGRQF